MTSEQLLHRIETFLAASGMGETYFGTLAARNPYLVRRLRAGRRVWPETAERVLAFIDASSSGTPDGLACAADSAGADDAAASVENHTNGGAA